MSARRVWVTGATGGLGRSVVTRFLQAGYIVHAIGRNRSIGVDLTVQGARFELMDLTQVVVDDWLQRLHHGDVVVHCAALSSPWGRYEDFYLANVVATERLAQAALAVGVQRFVHISTPSLYFDFCDCVNIREESVLPTPVNHYAATKSMAEMRVQASAAQGLRSVMLRPRAIFGEHDTVLVPRILRAYKNGRLPLIADGKALIDLTYVGNVADAVFLAATHDLDFSDACAKVYNITNDEPMHLKMVLDELFAAMRLPVRYRRLPWSVVKPLAHVLQTMGRMTGREPVLTPYSAGVLAFSQTLDITKAKQELGYVPRVSMSEGITRYVAWRNSSELMREVIHGER